MIVYCCIICIFGIVIDYIDICSSSCGSVVFAYI